MASFVVKLKEVFATHEALESTRSASNLEAMLRQCLPNELEDPLGSGVSWPCRSEGLLLVGEDSRNTHGRSRCRNTCCAGWIDYEVFKLGGHMFSE